MRHELIHRLVFIFCFALCAAATAAETPEDSFAGDPVVTIDFVPGKYYEQRAIEAVKNKHFHDAIEFYQKAGYWGNKIAQYDVGMLYLNGADGVPADKIRGIAWLGIAAQHHVPYVDKALGDAYAQASADERAQAGALWKQMMTDYDDKVTMDRASRRFNAQYLRFKGQIVGPPETATMVYGNFGGGGGDAGAKGAVINQLETIASHADSHAVNAARFMSAVKDQFSDFVQTQFGVVTVGEPETISEREQRAVAPAPAQH